MADYKLIARWCEEYYEQEVDDMTLEEWLEECERDYHRTVELDSYFYEIDPIFSASQGYMESHRREY